MLSVDSSNPRVQRRVELDLVLAHAQPTFDVLPDDTELQDSLGDGVDFQGGAILGVLPKDTAAKEVSNEVRVTDTKEDAVR